MEQWYCYRGGQQYGPVSQAELTRWAREGRIGPNDYVWTEGMADWAAAATVLGGEFAGGALAPTFARPTAAPIGGTGGQTPNGQLTAGARRRLAGNWGLPIAFSLLVGLLTLAIGLLPSFIGTIAQLILSGPFQLGVVIFYLSFSRGAAGSLGMMFWGFKRFGAALGTYMLVTVFIFLWSLLAAVPGIAFVIAALVSKSPEAAALGAFLAAVPAIVVSVIKSLAYSQAFYLLADDQTLGSQAAITRSKEMMNGNKTKLFCLGLRFFCWGMLCILTLGIGFLWLVPYMSVTYARFYDDLHAPSSSGSGEGSQEGPRDLGTGHATC